MKTRFMGRRRRSELKRHREVDDNPLDGVANLFDVAIVFVVALMLALVTYHSLPELVSSTSDVTIVKNPVTPDMEIIIKQGEKVEVQKITDEGILGMGRKLGTTYILEGGDVIYVPENATE
ncbi:MAG: DUF2149 domain-containing protein [Methanosarcinales archaeon]|nr:DUF2149 domain-containing protein [Methanosarcinales archaeon]